MGLRVETKIDNAPLERLASLANPKQRKMAVWSALQKTTGQVAVYYRTVAKEAYNITQHLAKQAITDGVSKGENPSGWIRVERKPLPLIGFRPRASKRNGVRVTMRKGDPAVVLQHAFLATVSGKRKDGSEYSHLGVFVRAKVASISPGYYTKRGISGFKLGKEKGRRFSSRYPIWQLKGAAISNLFDDQATRENLTAYASTILTKQVQSQLDRFTKAPKSTPA